MTHTQNINEYGQAVGFALPDWQPVLKPTGCELKGRFCQLTALNLAHSDGLFVAYSEAIDDRDWTWLGASKPRDIVQMQAWIEHKIRDERLVAYAVMDNMLNQPVGVVCYSNIDTDNGAIEIGHVTWSLLMKQRVTGSEALFLLLSHAFELGYRRVAWRCDSLNIASRRAAERMGFTFEGRFRQAMTRKQRNRDTDWLSIIDTEWPGISKAVSAWLAQDNINEHGLQKNSLKAFFATT